MSTGAKVANHSSSGPQPGGGRGWNFIDGAPSANWCGHEYLEVWTIGSEGGAEVGRPAAGARRARASATAAGSFLLALATTRLVRVLQTNGRLPGGGGLRVSGHHIHHFVWGLALVVLQGGIGVARAIPIDDRRRAVPLGVGLAVAADELDIIFGVEHWRLAQQDRPIADMALASCAVVVGAAGLRSLARRPLR